MAPSAPLARQPLATGAGAIYRAGR